MITISGEQIQSVAQYDELIHAVRTGFLVDVSSPERHVHSIDVPGAESGTLLVMPAWKSGAFLGVKIATIFPSNATRGLTSVTANYLLMDANTGKVLASIDGKSLTLVRTAATSALASTYLSRTDASSLLMIGSGALARPLIQAHAHVRPIRHVSIWSRTKSNAVRCASSLGSQRYSIAVVDSLEDSIPHADIITCATLSTDSLLPDALIRPGTHIDLVGAFNATMREVSSRTVSRSRVFVDTHAGARAEAGDLINAEKEGAWSFNHIQNDLAGLCKTHKFARISQKEITLFKSVGAACEDLAVSTLVYEKLSSR